MNERIKELALQAGDYVNEVYTPPVRSKTPGKIWEDGHIDWYTQFNEKFAELIVAECLEACSRANEIRHFVPPTQEQVVLSCMREIETTFRS
jgi:hypothetical protein